MKTQIIICLIAASFISGRKAENFQYTESKKEIYYYWFNTSGVYLRQNTLDDEALLTGYNNNPTNPKTLREKGYDPVNCARDSPPVPNSPSNPDQIMYSHP